MSPKKKKKKKEKKKRKKREATGQNPCASAHGHFRQSNKLSFPLPVFSTFWGKNILVSSERKHSGSITFFPFPLPTKHSLKNFPLHFSLLNFQFYLKSLQTNIPLGILRIALSVLVKPLLDFGHIQVHEDDFVDRNSTNYYPPYIYPLRN